MGETSETVRRDLIILGGLPGSGKSYQAKLLRNPDLLTAVVSDDAMRLMLLGDYVFDDEDGDAMVQHAVFSTAAQLVIGGCDRVIVDAPNITVEKRAAFIKLAKHFEVTPKIVWCIGDESNLLRRMTDPRGVSRERWTQVINYFEEITEFPTVDECEDITIVPPPQFKG